MESHIYQEVYVRFGGGVFLWNILAYGFLTLAKGVVSSPPIVDTTASTLSMVWRYIGELIFNMLVLVGTVKMSNHLKKYMLGYSKKIFIEKSGIYDVDCQ